MEGKRTSLRGDLDLSLLLLPAGLLSNVFSLLAVCPKLSPRYITLAFAASMVSWRLVILDFKNSSLPMSLSCPMASFAYSLHSSPG